MLCLCTVSVSHESQHFPAREAEFPAARGSLLSPPNNRPLPHRGTGPWPLSPEANHSQQRSLGRSPAHLILVSVSLLAPRCQGLTYPQPHSRSRWLLCEGHCAQRLVAADPASPRPSLRHTRRHPGFPGPPSFRHPSFFLSHSMVGLDTEGKDPCSGHRRQATVLQTTNATVLARACISHGRG